MEIQAVPTVDELRESMKGFAIAMADAIGTTETYVMLNKLAEFAKTCPETLQEIKVLVEENPDTIKSLLTPNGVIEAKKLIELVKEWAPAFEAFK